MTSNEGTQMLIQRVPTPPKDTIAFQQLAKRLSAWPLLLKLAGGTLKNRLSRGDSIEGAMEYINRALDKRGVTAFDERGALERDAAVAHTFAVSLDLLKGEERRHLAELSIFPPDTDIPLTTIKLFWGLDDLDTEQLAQHFADRSLLDPAGLDQVAESRTGHGVPAIR
jgi:hypothetical protein